MMRNSFCCSMFWRCGIPPVKTASAHSSEQHRIDSYRVMGEEIDIAAHNLKAQRSPLYPICERGTTASQAFSGRMDYGSARSC